MHTKSSRVIENSWESRKTKVFSSEIITAIQFHSTKHLSAVCTKMQNNKNEEDFFLKIVRLQPPKLVMMHDHRLSDSDDVSMCRTCKLYFHPIDDRSHPFDCLASVERILAKPAPETDPEQELIENLWNQRIKKAVELERNHKSDTTRFDKPRIDKDIKVMTNLKRELDKSKINTKKLSKQLKFLESL